jgi:predicted TIM-barrel fold metal-dependent hydrolase
MEFFDCNTSYGLNYKVEGLLPEVNMHGLVKEMEKTGVKKAMVWRKEQLHGAPPEVGNNLLAEDMKKESNLFGIWTIVPYQTHEIPDPWHMLEKMRENKIFAWQLFPVNLHFLPKAFALKEWLKLAIKHYIPIYMNPSNGMSLDAAADILEKYPELTVILSSVSIWPEDRFLRPFISEFPNVYLDLSQIITANGIESLVNEYGAGRLLYGSGFPDAYFGANMLMINNSKIPYESKELIAGKNMENIIRRIRL